MPSPLDPSPIMQLTTAYWGSMALFTANDLGVFTKLADGPRPPATLAATLGVAERPLRMLLQALVGLGVLESVEGGFANSDLASQYLVEGRPAFLGAAIRYAADCYLLWNSLADVVRSGRPAVAADEYLGADPARTRRFVWGMHARALGVARAVAHSIELPPRVTLLDLGGGPGTYSLLLAQRLPELRAIVFDLPPVVAITTEIIASFGLGERVTVQPGDFLCDPYPPDVGAALLSGILHREPESTCRMILAKVWTALVPGGQIIISDVMLNADRVSPPFATLFALHMLATSSRGGAHAKDDHARWLESVGFHDVRIRDQPPPSPHTLITATKPLAR